jgi:hypothetical protein
MSQDKSQLCKEFEREFWLYLDGDLSEERMKFWNNKLDEVPELRNYIEEYISVSNNYETVKNIELDSHKVNAMVSKAVNQNSLMSRIEHFFSNIFTSEKEFSFGKIAFGSALIIGAIVISLISNKPNPVVNLSETINSELLDWDADFVDDQISKVGTLLKVTKDEEYRKYIKYKLTTSSVDKNINLIDKNIKTLKEELNNKEL